MLVALRADNIFGFLARRFTPRTIFMGIGAAGCDLALRAAGYVERAYSIDVSGRLRRDVLVPCNLRRVICDGVHIPVPAASIDIAWGGNFLDHLNPAQARDHLAAVQRGLVAGGAYLCSSANPGRLRALLLEAGFARVACYVGALRLPWVLAARFPARLLRLSAIRA
jgi:hypothetical protein